MKQPALHIFLVLTIAFLCVGVLMVGFSETGQAANTPAVQTSQSAPFSIDSPPPSITNSHSLNIVGNNAYLFGSFSNNSFKKFDILQHTWTLSNTSNVITTSLEGYASGVLSNTIFTMGGVNSDNVQRADVWKYDPATNTWSRVDNEMSSPPTDGRAGGTFTGVPSTGNFLAFGGARPWSMGKDAVWIYDPSTGFWTTYNMSNPQGDRDGHSAGVIGNKLYVVGGDINDEDAFIQYTDLNGSSWSNQALTMTMAGRPTPRKDQATVFDPSAGNIYIFGGKAVTVTVGLAENVNTAAVLTDSWRFNLNTLQWYRLADLPQVLTNTLAVGWVATSTTDAVGLKKQLFDILIVGEQISDGVLTSYVFDGQDYIQKELPRYPIYLPMLIRD